VIRKQGSSTLVGTWRADARSLTVETDDPDLRRVADEVLATPQVIPQKPPEKWVPAGRDDAAYEPPASQKYLILFALELESRGYTVEPGEDG
jgi:hypothetical protein